MQRLDHWEKVYATKGDQDVGWFQENPETSLLLINKYAQNKSLPIIDVGAGNSFLTVKLFEEGYKNLTILDISSRALERSRKRFGDESNHLSWIQSDVLAFTSDKAFQIWHDRAVFHFLTEDTEIGQYAQNAAHNIASGGYLILGTFSLSGPGSCSGLPITQYSEEKVKKVFLDHFTIIESFENVHQTPSGNNQDFIWAVLQRH